MDLYLFHLDVSLCLISNTSASVLDVNDIADLNYSSQFTCQTLIESLSVRSLKRVAGFQTEGHFIRARLEQRGGGGVSKAAG